MFVKNFKDDQLVAQARIDEANRKSYNRIVIASILIFNGIIVAFLIFLFMFPFEKYF